MTLVKALSSTKFIELGQLVPDFSLPQTGGTIFSLKANRGKKVVLYFYPKDSTPGCTIEGQEFSKLRLNFAKKNCAIYGLSRDSLKSHENFKMKQGYTVELLSDTEEKVCQLFSVIKEKNMYGKKVLGIERSTFVIDEDGRLVAEWRKVKVEGHAAEVLEKVKAL